MPHILDPTSSGRFSGHLERGVEIVGDLSSIAGKYDYEYPEGLDLSPGTKHHDQILGKLMHRAREGYNEFKKRHDDWRNIDRSLKAYVYQPEAGRDAHEDEVDGSTHKIILPVSHAALETILTYFTSAFMQDPVFDYEGTGPEDILGSLLLTHIVQKHVRHYAMGLNFHTAWRDMFAYGIGVTHAMWDQEMAKRVVKREVGYVDLLKKVFYPTRNERTEGEYEVIFEGNKLENIDPYTFFMDPNVAAHEVEKAEYVGWISEDNLNSLLMQEKRTNGNLFNVRYLRHLNPLSSSLLSETSGREGRRPNIRPATTSPVSVVWMYVSLIPREWGLGQDGYPETWVFAVAADKVIIEARPLGLTRDRIPVAIGAPESDGYSVAPASRLMIVEELQNLIDFLFTSHIANVKRVINDNLVVDPSMVNIHDVLDNKPGKVIRLRRRIWGKGSIRDVIDQLKVTDVTQGNVQDAVFLQGLLQQFTAATDNVQGTLAPRTSRVSARESADVRNSALSRLERPARLVSMQMMLPLARMFANNVQQLMSEDTYIKTTGDLERRLIEEFAITPNQLRGNRFAVSPLDMIVRYDVEPRDGTIPGREDAQIWVELFQVLGQSPELAQQFDIVRIFKHIAREMGARNVDEFVRRQRPPQVMEDGRVAELARQGNAVPLDEIGGDGAPA